MRSFHLLGALIASGVLFSISSAKTPVLKTRDVLHLGDITEGAGWQGVRVSSESAFISSATHAIAGEHDRLSQFAGLRFDVDLPSDKTFNLKLIARADANDAYPQELSVAIPVTGKGWHTIFHPWKHFQLPQQQGRMIDSLKEIAISATDNDGKAIEIGVRNFDIVKSDRIYLSSPVTGIAVEAGKTAEYNLNVSNCTYEKQVVTLIPKRNGPEAMTCVISSEQVELDPGESKQLSVRVQVPNRVPPGGFEVQSIHAIANGEVDSTSTIKLYTAAQLAHPNIIFTQDGWERVREKVNKYDWARRSLEGYVKVANDWKVPPVANRDNPKRGDWLFATQIENSFLAASYSYQITGNIDHAKKVREFLMNLSNPINGFPITHRACNQASVQEGHFFQHIAKAYDMTLPSGVYSDEDKNQINTTLRLFIDDDPGSGGQISNWNVSSLIGGLYCSLVLQDLGAAHHFMEEHGGIIDQLREGILDDGWWYECSISYNTWVAGEFTQAALALKPWGYDFFRSYPNAFRPNDEKKPEVELYGMSKARWGPIYHSSVNIKRMWDALPPMLDYRGMIFGLNDSSGKPIAGPQMDIAYYAFRDPAYIPVIQRGGERDLLYSVPELPEAGIDPSAQSAFADNVGVAVLRSQTENRPRSEQIQAVMHYGDHGWFHGHFDQTNLLHLSRYGRSFFHPEFIWYGYPNFMYKFYVQTSVSKNMVVVDQKMQEPVESKRTMFHTGKMMQASIVERSARWSNPPYGGMRYDDTPYKTFADKSLAENRSVPIPKDAPEYGKVTDYSEPIFQRRMMIVTDDYVLLADYLKGEKEHTFESLFQMKGFKGLESENKKLNRHVNQWTENPLSSAQFVTDCDWYDVTAPARGSYEFKWGEGADNEGTLNDSNEPGVLKIDLHSIWPARQQIMIGMPPEDHSISKRLKWSITGDSKSLAGNEFGAWVLGKDQIDLPIENINSLELITNVQGGKWSTIFWGGMQVVTAEGKIVPLSRLNPTFENIDQPAESGRDYRGGPIKIVGQKIDSALAGEPKDKKKNGVIRFDLTGLKAVKLQGVIGGDFPIGDETQRRKTVAIRDTGTTAKFLTILEPFENRAMIKNAIAENENKIRVELADGRVQIIDISGFYDGGQKSVVTMTESRENMTLRSESTEH